MQYTSMTKDYRRLFKNRCAGCNADLATADYDKDTHTLTCKRCDFRITEEAMNCILAKGVNKQITDTLYNQMLDNQELAAHSPIYDPL